MNSVVAEPSGPQSPVPAPPSRPRLIVSDLDGTFLSPDGTVSSRNAAAVTAAERAGIGVIFATGRPLRWLDPVLGHLDRDIPAAAGLEGALAIASNGAMIYDLVRREVLESELISAEEAVAAITELRAAIPGVVFGLDSGHQAGYEPGYRAVRGISWDIDADPYARVADLDELLDSAPFGKLLVLHPDSDPDRLTGQVREVLGDRLAATHSSPTRALVEVSAPGVSKAAALSRLCAARGIAAAEVAAFGDMPNDLEMLSWAGMPHVMAEAHPDLLALGVPVIGSNADSAVGATIERWLAD